MVSVRDVHGYPAVAHALVAFPKSLRLQTKVLLPQRVGLTLALSTAIFPRDQTFTAEARLVMLSELLRPPQSRQALLRTRDPRTHLHGKVFAHSRRSVLRL